MYTEIALSYLENFSNKNLTEIKNVMSESVTLRDWDAEAFGKTDVVDFMAGLFSKFDTIDVEVHNVFDSKNTVIVEMTITLEDDKDTNELLVTDVITFDQTGKIESIRAYLG